MAPGDEGTAELEEGLVDVGPALVADTQTAHAVQPGKGAPDFPAAFAQAFKGLDVPPCNAGANTAALQILAQVGEIIALVGMHLTGRRRGWLGRGACQSRSLRQQVVPEP